MKAFWNYYRIVNLVNLCFSIIVAVVFNKILWLPVIFCTFGLGAGIVTFNTFFGYQYYLYHNLGYTRQKLALMVFGFNLIPAFAMLMITLLFS